MAFSSSIYELNICLLEVLAVTRFCMLSVVSRANANILHTRLGRSERRAPPAPIRTPERSSRLGGQKANSSHTAPRHNIVQKAIFALTHFPAAFIRLWPSCHIDLRGIDTWLGGGGLFPEQTSDPIQ